MSYKISVHDLIACAPQNWIPICRKETFKTVSIELTEEVVSFLLEDGIHLPENAISEDMSHVNSLFEPNSRVSRNFFLPSKMLLQSWMAWLYPN